MAEQCPNCKIHFDAPDNMATLIVGPDDRQVDVESYICPKCEQYIVYATVPERKRVYPSVRESVDLSKFVPVSLLRDFEEAKRVLDVSPNASAMLSRRSLQRLIREHLGITKGTLVEEIQSAVRSGQLPSYLAEDLDAVRLIGNFGAHPKKSQNTGEIVDVEPGEAVWTIEVLEGLFDFYFVAPQKATERRQSLNQKLTEAGQQPMKSSSVITFPKMFAQ